MARLKAAANIRQQQQLVQQEQQLKLFKHVPARLPPSQRAITDWLDAVSAMYAPPAASSSSSSRAAAAQAAAGSGFVMDANTGRLVPLQASATQVAASSKPVASNLIQIIENSPCSHVCLAHGQTPKLAW